MKKAIMVLALVAALLPAQARALQNEEVLALVAMPLAVAAVSEMPEVPRAQLVEVVSLLNDARVPPVQFVEVVRYVPVALVAEDGPVFVRELRVQREQGVTGLSFVDLIRDRLRRYDLPDLDFNDVETRRIVYDVRAPETFLPQIVRTRVIESRNHPHGGPPGQLKKELGLQTGAEVVHGDRPGSRGRVTRSNDVVVRRTPAIKEKNDKGRKVVDDSARVKVDRGRSGSDHPSTGKSKGGGKSSDAGGGKGKGKGHGGNK